MKKKNPMAASPMDDYESSEDVRAMQRAAEVKSDPKRHAKAKSQAKKMLGEHQKKTAALSMIARQSKATKKASKKFNKTKFSDLPY